MKPDQKFRLSFFLIVLVVVVGHLLFFWAVADKHFMPKASPYIPPPKPPNFGSATRRTVDPHTGDAVTETQFLISTTFATPARPPLPAASPN